MGSTQCQVAEGGDGREGLGGLQHCICFSTPPPPTPTSSPAGASKPWAQCRPWRGLGNSLRVSEFRLPPLSEGGLPNLCPHPTPQFPQLPSQPNFKTPKEPRLFSGEL